MAPWIESAEPASLDLASFTIMFTFSVTLLMMCFASPCMKASEPTGLPHARKPSTTLKPSTAASFMASMVSAGATVERSSSSHLTGCSRRPEPSMAFSTFFVMLKAMLQVPTM